MRRCATRANLSLDDFIEALDLLSRYLENPIELRVVGGFALMARRLRLSGVTADIDTVTADWDVSTYSAITRVANELNLPPDWINNDTVFSYGDCVTEEDVEAFDELLNARYEPFDFGIENVRIHVADVNTLVRSKAFAASDIGLGRSEKDLDDLVSLIDAAGARNYRQALEMFPWLTDVEFSGLLPRLETALDIPEPPERPFKVVGPCPELNTAYFASTRADEEYLR